MDSIRGNSAINRAMQSNKVHDSAGRCLTWSTQIGTVVESTPLICARSSEKAINRWWGSRSGDDDLLPDDPSDPTASVGAAEAEAPEPETTNDDADIEGACELMNDLALIAEEDEAAQQAEDDYEAQQVIELLQEELIEVPGAAAAEEEKVEEAPTAPAPLRRSGRRRGGMIS